nr:putative virion core protein P4b [Wadden Sea poxvirus]
MDIDDVFLNSNICLGNTYKNQNLSFVDNQHIHSSISSISCNICNSLYNISDDTVFAGIKQQKSISLKKKQSLLHEKDDNPCKIKNNSKMIPIDEVVSTNNWHVGIRKDGDLIAKYLTENKCNIDTFTIQDMLNIMQKLNIIRTDRNEIFELLGHVKSSLSNSNISVKNTHPLVLIHSHAHPKIGEQIRELDKIYSPSRHETLLSTTRFQSIYFTDMSSSQDLAFHYRDKDSNYFIHPILVALFGVKLPALENTFVYGDSYSLLQQLYDFRKVRQDNYMLLVNRLTEDSPIVFTGITDVISTEIQRANIHTMIRKAIMNIRMGIFYSRDEDAVDPYLMKIIHTNCSQIMSDEEQMLASILSIVGFKPTLVSVSGSGNINNYNMKLQSVPYIVINTMKMITTSESPISINSNNIYSLTFDGGSGRVVFAPPNIGYGGINSQLSGVYNIEQFYNNCNNTNNGIYSPVIVNGVLMFYVERRHHKNSFGGECYTGYRSLINDTPIDISQEISINGILYRLKSAVCYKVGDQFFETSCNNSSNDIFLKGHYTILFTELGAWMYDPLSVFNKSSRDARMLRSLKNQYKKVSDQDDDVGFYDWVKGEGSNYVIMKQQMLMNNITMFEDDILKIEEAMSLISRHCCILIYAQDYEPYITAKSITELF